MSSSSRGKIATLDALVPRLERLRAAGSRIALANGIFDLVHVGHLRYLEGARNTGDVLVVAINSDRSARALKGPGRPLVPAEERAELVAGFACVDHVVIFDEERVDGVLRVLRPHVHCKGTDYTPQTVPERHTAEALGIEVAIVGDPKAHATSEIIRKIRALPDD